MNLLSWRRKYILCWAFLVMVSMLEAHVRSWEIVDPRNLKVSTADTVLLSMGRGGSVGGAPPEVLCHLHSFELVQPQVVLTTSEGQLFNLYADSSLSLMRPMTVMSSANLRSLTDGCSRWCRGRRAVGRAHIPRGRQC